MLFLAVRFIFCNIKVVDLAVDRHARGLFSEVSF